MRKTDQNKDLDRALTIGLELSVGSERSLKLKVDAVHFETLSRINAGSMSSSVLAVIVI